jgi:chromosomal replication initiation ATPase DnaA
MITKKAYKEQLANKMIDKFVKDLREKTGYKATVMMDHLIAKKERDTASGFISLPALEEAFLKAYPLPLPVNPLRLKSRKLEHVEARCVFCYIAKENMRFTITGIGKHLGKDHTSVIHMNRRANDLLETEDRFYNLYKETMDNLNIAHAKTI